MKPGDRVSLKNAINKTVGTIMRPAADDVDSAWVVKISGTTHIVASDSELELVE